MHALGMIAELPELPRERSHQTEDEAA